MSKLTFSASVLSLAGDKGAALAGAVADVEAFTLSGLTHGDFSGFRNTLDKIGDKAQASADKVTGDAVPSVAVGVVLALRAADSSARLARKDGSDAQAIAPVIALAFKAQIEAYAAARSDKGKATAEKAKAKRAANEAKETAAAEQQAAHIAALQAKVDAAVVITCAGDVIEYIMGRDADFRDAVLTGLTARVIAMGESAKAEAVATAAKAPRKLRKVAIAA